MKGIIKDALILCLITLIAGLMLGAVYEITKEPIAIAQKNAKDAACSEVFSDAQEFMAVCEDMDFEGVLLENGYTGDSVTEVLAALDDNKNVLGYVLTVVSHEGYGGDIEFLVGIRNDGTVNGISITAIGETAGLGMKANTAAFKSQFAGKNVEEFVYTKSKSENAPDYEIDAISAATITTNAMTNGVNSALCIFRYITENGGVTVE